jgi:TatD DNase family protein
MHVAGVGTIAVGCDYSSSLRAVDLSQCNVHVWACVGMHPVDTKNIFKKSDFIGLLSAKKANGAPAVVAVGECGLDYFRGADEAEKLRQKESFRNQILFSLEHSLPLMLHIRPSKGTVDAHEDALSILGEYNGLRGTCHFFTASVAVAQKYVQLGFYVSFPGVITFAPELAPIVVSVPLTRTLLETDSPYASPVPFRGQQNEPVRAIEVAQKIAAIHGISYEEVCAQTTQNAKDLFGLL